MKSAHGHDWKLRQLEKKNRGSQTPGKQKVLTCRHKPPKKFLASRSRSYKHPDYSNWNKIFSKR